MNNRKADKNSGGGGQAGPPDDSPLKDLWTILQADNLSESNVPATGARLAMQLMMQNVIRASPGAGVAGAGIAGVNALWGK